MKKTMTIFSFAYFSGGFSKLLIISGNVHTNPGPGPSPRYEGLLKFMYWNVVDW